MASILEAQKSLGKDFDLGGTSDKGSLKLDAVEKVMYDASNKFIKLAIQRINQKKKVDKGNLSDITVSTIIKTGNKYSLTIGYDELNPASKYYDSINKGKSGVKVKRPNTPYKYKSLNVSKEFVQAILEWYLRHKSYIKNDDQKKGLRGLQKKRKSIAKIVDKTKDLNALAFNTAKKIKRVGNERTGFFEDNLDKAFGEDFKAKLAQALGQDIALTITQTFKK